jgi:hypothetical protein
MSTGEKSISRQSGLTRSTLMRNVSPTRQIFRRRWPVSVW